MSEQNAKALLDRFNADPDFRRMLKEAATPEEKKRIVIDAGFDFHRGDLDTIRRLVEHDGEISDEELDKVVGGIGSEATLNTVGNIIFNIP